MGPIPGLYKILAVLEIGNITGDLGFLNPMLLTAFEVANLPFLKYYFCWH